jgi:hypothetical protein
MAFREGQAEEFGSRVWIATAVPGQGVVVRNENRQDRS